MDNAITEQQYKDAVSAKKAAEDTITNYFRQREKRFQDRLKSGTPFTDDELHYSARTLCPCGHGLAYPKDCGGQHYWDCSAKLKGIADAAAEHTPHLPFAFYDVKSESDYRGTTRGVFRPRTPATEQGES